MKRIIIFSLISINFAHADDLLIHKHDVQLKNVYNDKNFHQGEDTGSWSQGIIYRGEISKKIKDVNVSLLPSFQYAHRLGNSHELSDGTYAFDSLTKTQPHQYHKEGLALKLEYENHSLQVGEQWLNLPITGLDGTKQLLPTYQGIIYSYVPNKLTEMNLGYINKYNPKDEEDFKALTVGSTESDGLYYFNIKHRFNESLEAQFYNGYLLDMYNHIYIGGTYTSKINPDLSNNFTLKYFNSSGVGDEKIGDIKVNYYGVMDELNYLDASVSFGYQKIDGNQNFPLLMGIPARYFINWTQGMFNKQDESSYHFNFKYKMDKWVPGMDLTYRYIYGDNFKTNGLDNREIERDIIVNYNFLQPKLKGLGLQVLYINYDAAIGKDYDEVRVTTRYQRKF